MQLIVINLILLLLKVAITREPQEAIEKVIKMLPTS